MAPDETGVYADFRIRISRRAPHGYSVRATCRGAATSGTFELPFSSEGLELLLLKTQPRRTVTRAATRSAAVSAAREIGENLYRALFDGHVGTLLWKETAVASGGLRITLELSDVPELMNLPWEYLYEPDKGHFLAKSGSTPIVRYLDVPSEQRPLHVDLPLRMLAVISSPLDVPPLDVKHEQELLNDALRELTSKGLVDIDWLEAGTRGGVRRKLRSAAHAGAPYHIFHFIGHGSFEEAQGEGFLLLEDAQKRSDPIDGRSLGEMLYEHKSLRLAVLNSCEGARAANTLNEPFAGVAARLIRNEIPAVVAMQFEITDDAAASFSSGFYTAVARGEPVDSALVDVRQDLSDVDPGGVEWGTPVLFMRVDDGRIFNVAETATRTDPITAKPPLEVERDPEPTDAGASTARRAREGLRGRRVVPVAAAIAIVGIAAAIVAVSRRGESGLPETPPISAIEEAPIANLGPFSNSSQPSWNADGTMIAFTVDQGGTKVYVAKVTGLSPRGKPKASGTTLLAAGSAWPSWSNDGRIAYVKGSEIWVTDKQGRRDAFLTRGGFPAWSPDAGKLVFSSGGDLYTISSSGRGAPARLTRDASTSDIFPAWSPDGGRIAFIRRPLGNSCLPGQLWIVNADRSRPHRLLELRGDQRHPTWSPTGALIVFSSDHAGSHDLYDVHADGSKLRPLTNTSADEVGPSWGKKGIAYARGTFDCASSEGSSQDLWFRADGS